MADYSDPVSVVDLPPRFFLYLILAAILTGAIVGTVRKRGSEDSERGAIPPAGLEMENLGDPGAVDD